MSVYMDFFFHVNLADKQENEQTALWIRTHNVK